MYRFLRAASTELKYLDFPLPYSVLCKDLQSSFAGKLHALLCRSYLKGRDWFDFVWYVSQGVTINLDFLQQAINQVGPWQDQDETVDNQWVITHLGERITQIDWNNAKADVSKFLKPSDQKSLDLWSYEFFQTRVDKLADTVLFK